MSSFAIASGKAQRLDELRGGLAPTHSRCTAALGEPPCIPSLHSQTLRDCAAGQLRQLAERSEPETLELRIAVRCHRKQRERQRLEERLFLLGGDEKNLTGTRDARGCERGEAPAGSADARIPRRADRRERALERRLNTAVQALDALRLEDDCTLLDRIDGEARVLEAPQDTLPLPLDSGWIAIDEDERRAGGECLPQAHPRLHSGCLGRRGDRPEKRLLSRLRRERRGDERQPRPCAQRRSQLEPWNEETRDHSNTCSIRTYVLLSTQFPVSVWP